MLLTAFVLRQIIVGLKQDYRVRNIFDLLENG